MGNPEYTHTLKMRAFAARSEGLSFREISEVLKNELGLTVPPTTIHGWCQGHETQQLIRDLRDRVIAQATERAHAVTPALFDRIEDAARDNDAKAADAWSRAITNLTRHLVGERVELMTSVPDSSDELSALLDRHGVLLEQRAKPGALE